MSTIKKYLLTAGLALLCMAALTGCGQPAPSESQSVPAQSSSQSTPAEESDVYEAEGHWFKKQDAADLDSVDKLAQKISGLKSKYMTENNRVYCAIIPDKSEFLTDAALPVLDSAPMTERLAEKLEGVTLIDLDGTLTLNNYFRADGHWQQQELQPVLDALGQAMEFSVDLSSFEQHSHEGFVGAYSEDIPPEQQPEEALVYLTAPAIDSASVKHFQGNCTTVYDLPRLDTKIPYDVFLSGATPLVTITCPDAESDRELVIFRDSFGSSIAPLLCGEYRTITLVDLRYMVSGMLPQYLEFTDQDVLFLYSAAVANQSAMLR